MWKAFLGKLAIVAVVGGVVFAIALAGKQVNAVVADTCTVTSVRDVPTWVSGVKGFTRIETKICTE